MCTVCVCATVCATVCDCVCIVSMRLSIYHKKEIMLKQFTLEYCVSNALRVLQDIRVHFSAQPRLQSVATVAPLITPLITPLSIPVSERP